MDINASISYKTITATINIDQKVTGCISNARIINGDVGIPDSYTFSYDVYDGETTIVPSTHADQVLETANKLVSENITIKEVPTFETSNTYGTSFIIGD